MGVHGLWRLIEPSGKPVPLETLENKILAVDISIWLHQAIKGFQDSRGAPLPNAHLLGIYHRVCKLLYFRVKPVFVFDGGVPMLKKQTIAKRNQQKTKMINDASNIQEKLLRTLMKHSAVSKVIAEKTNSPPKKKRHEDTDATENMFILPEQPAEDLDSTLDSSISSTEDGSSSSPTKQWDLHTIDEKSEHFRSLPADLRHEILTECIETRKQSSWGRLHELPSESGDFSRFQMNRLLKRYSVQVSLEEAQKEMGGHTLSLGELEALLNEEGVVTTSNSNTGSRIASDENKRFLLIKDVKKAMEKAKDNENKTVPDSSTNETNLISDEFENDLITAIQLSMPEKNTDIPDITTEKIIPKNDEFEKDLAAAIQLSLQDQPSTSKSIEQKESTFLENFNDGDFASESESDEEKIVPRLAQAKSYMLEYSGLTPNEIANILNQNGKKSKEPKKQNKLAIIQNDVIDTEPLNAIHNVENKVVNLEKQDSNVCVGNKTPTKVIEKRDSDSNESDFEEVPEKTEEKQISSTSVDIISDSEDSDFVEVDDTLANSKLNIENKPSLEIIIDLKENIQDDIFGDIFSEAKNETQKETLPVKNDEKVSENKQETATVVEKNVDLNLIPRDKENNDLKDSVDIQSSKLAVLAKPDKPMLTSEELNAMKNDLAQEKQQLILERNSRERMAGNITDQMYLEAQELLELFGVPYIVAPMEAEAQCAFLNEIDLTDGTITDDSDIWLFGGKTVYKNFFNHNKHVLEFRAESIEHHFKLTREQLILLALLVGSDYTVGIQGIGPVTALEILAAFPPAKNTKISVLTQNELLSGLAEFRKWLLEGKTVGAGRTALRSKLRNVNINEGFPNLQVVQAYLQPKIETCRDKFTWGKPDVVGLIDFAKEKFGWTKLKSEEILKPVIKKLEDKNIQRSIRDYFATKHKLDIDTAQSKMSKRVKTAVNRMGKAGDESSSEEKPTKNKKGRKKAPNKSETEAQGAVAAPKCKNDLAGAAPRRKAKAKTTEQMHAKELIPQKERDKIYALKNKLKAIEVFRKSKRGPGFVNKRPKTAPNIKDEAELSESSNSD